MVASKATSFEKSPTANRSVYVIGAAGFCALIHQISTPKPVGALSARLCG